MSTAVVTVAAGGIPVVELVAGSRGLPVTEATNGRGIAVTKVVGKPGLPVVFDTIGVGPAPPSAEVTQFLTRTSGLDSTHTNAYTALIDGLVADGIWSKLDALYIFATQDSTTAKLNLVSTNYAAVAVGSPTFTADRGYTGVDASTTIALNIFITSPVPVNYTQNDAHVSAWSNTNTTSSASGGYIMGRAEPGLVAGIAPKFSDGNSYMAINGANSVTANANSTGHYLASRSISGTASTYRNATVLAGGPYSTGLLPDLNFVALAVRTNTGAIQQGSACQVTMVSLGGALSSTQVTNFYNRLRTYMTTVGVP